MRQCGSLSGFSGGRGPPGAKEEARLLAGMPIVERRFVSILAVYCLNGVSFFSVQQKSGDIPEEGYMPGGGLRGGYI